jgi:hypothetical protein
LLDDTCGGDLPWQLVRRYLLLKLGVRLFLYPEGGMIGLVAGLPTHILTLTRPLRALILNVGFQRLRRDLKR